LGPREAVTPTNTICASLLSSSFPTHCLYSHRACLCPKLSQFTQPRDPRAVSCITVWSLVRVLLLQEKPPGGEISLLRLSGTALQQWACRCHPREGASGELPSSLALWPKVQYLPSIGLRVRHSSGLEWAVGGRYRCRGCCCPPDCASLGILQRAWL
jgi:hypothetical protein